VIEVLLCALSMAAHKRWTLENSGVKRQFRFTHRRLPLQVGEYSVKMIKRQG
jgi:hypothetical protein